MAKLEETLNEDFDLLLARVEDGILHGSMSASLEDASDFKCGDARCSVRVFERFRRGTVRFICLRLQPAAARLCFLKSIPGVRKHFLIN